MGSTSIIHKIERRQLSYPPLHGNSQIYQADIPINPFLRNIAQ